MKNAGTGTKVGVGRGENRYSVPSPALRRARRFVSQFLMPLVDDGWEYGDGTPLYLDVRSLVRMMRTKMPELF